MNKKRAFTLAEVLITLGVIGIVAAMTLPVLVEKYKERATVTAVKQVYSIFSQALRMITVDYPDLYALIDESKTSKENSQTMFTKLSEHIKKLKSCDVATDCMPDKYTTLSGTTLNNSWDNYNNIVTGVLANGTSFWILLNYCSDASSCTSGQIGVDINGRKAPNKLGVDFFWITYDRYGNVTAGRNPNNPDIPAGTYRCCSLNNSYNQTFNGYGCTEWILNYGNMDYLKKDISQ